MNDNQLVTIEQLEAFVSVSRDMSFVGGTRREKYLWMERLLTRFWYRSSRKKNKSIIKQYAMKMTGYSDAQMTRLLKEYVKTKHIVMKESKTRPRFAKRYTALDIARLIETDRVHRTLSGKATREIFRRSFEIFSDERFVRLKDISISHLYNLRETRQYTSNSLTFTKTSSTRSVIGERRKPFPDQKPGYIRVDSVHQGDMEGEKGVYHINLVDEVTQWEIVCCVEAIREEYLLPVLTEALKSFPFTIFNFHSDNGSEYINHEVASMLNEMVVKQTKSRSRHSNDNALAETKNGSVIRKHMGYIHISRQHADRIQSFYKTYFNHYLNFHRPSGYAHTITNKKGREKKEYHLYETPYEHLKKIPNSDTYLKPEVTFSYLNKLAYATDDNTCATIMQKARDVLFKSFRT
ncbi:MAG: DDE-type integrase/transposase/recombinase [Candidatus Andersenbacteria bacterium]|nr:DDE-type integrase/transposase/recombinase [Candidatus Andersenbacteria bacterium]